MTPDSHRWNADIDPTVIIDDDGTPWMAWGNGDCYMARLKKNMHEIDGEVKKVPLRNYSEGPWLMKRNDIYYIIYAADAPGVQEEQMAYSTAPSINGPWAYGGFISTSANHGFTIHPSVISSRDNGITYTMTEATPLMVHLEVSVVAACVRNTCTSMKTVLSALFLLLRRD